MSDIFSWFLLLRSSQEDREADADANKEVIAPPFPENRLVSKASNATIDSPSGHPNVVTPTNQPKGNKRKSFLLKSPREQQPKVRSKKNTSPSSKSKQDDSEKWLQGMQAWLLHAEDGPKLTRKLLRQTMDSVQALTLGQGLPATVYSGGAVFLSHQPVDWETVDLAGMKEAAQRFCQQKAVSIKRARDVFVGPLEHVQLYRNHRTEASI